jgi:hypothetical protein
MSNKSPGDDKPTKGWTGGTVGRSFDEWKHDLTNDFPPVDDQAPAVYYQYVMIVKEPLDYWEITPIRETACAGYFVARRTLSVYGR